MHVIEFTNDTARDLPESTRARLAASYKEDTPVEKQREQSARSRTVSEKLRQAHIDSVKERAARETQRSEEASARKRRMAEAETQKLKEKLDTSNQKHEALLQERKHEALLQKARRAALAEAASAQRQAMEVELLQAGVQKAEREKQAVRSRDMQVEEVVKRNQEQVNHAMQVAQQQKELKTERGDADGGQLDAPQHAMPALEQPTAATPRPSEPSPRWTEKPKDPGNEIKGLGLTVRTSQTSSSTHAIYTCAAARYRSFTFALRLQLSCSIALLSPLCGEAAPYTSASCLWRRWRRCPSSGRTRQTRRASPSLLADPRCPPVRIAAAAVICPI